VAFKNPDGSKVLLVLNKNDGLKTVRIVWQATNVLYYDVPGNAAITFTWE
jgi:glucosylceramidase